MRHDVHQHPASPPGYVVLFNGTCAYEHDCFVLYSKVLIILRGLITHTWCATYVEMKPVSLTL